MGDISIAQKTTTIQSSKEESENIFSARRHKMERETVKNGQNKWKHKPKKSLREKGEHKYIR